MVGSGPVAPGKKKTDIFKALPEIMALIRPRRALLSLGLALMVINRVSGLVLPASTKYLVDDVIAKSTSIACIHSSEWCCCDADPGTHVVRPDRRRFLRPRRSLIAELRRRVQEHIGRLPVAYYDANKTGMLVSRIMSDVEGVRNLSARDWSTSLAA